MLCFATGFHRFFFERVWITKNSSVNMSVCLLSKISERLGSKILIKINLSLVWL